MHLLFYEISVCLSICNVCDIACLFCVNVVVLFFCLFWFWCVFCVVCGLFVFLSCVDVWFWLFCIFIIIMICFWLCLFVYGFCGFDFQCSFVFEMLFCVSACCCYKFKYKYVLCVWCCWICVCVFFFLKKYGCFYIIYVHDWCVWLLLYFVYVSFVAPGVCWCVFIYICIVIDLCMFAL